MALARDARRAVPALIIACALGVAACGEDDVERGVDEGADAAEEAGRKAKDAAEEAGRKAKEAGEDAAREAEKELRD